MFFNFKTKLPACFQYYRGPKLSVHSCSQEQKWLHLKQIRRANRCLCGPEWRGNILKRDINFEKLRSFIDFLESMNVGVG